MSLTKTKCPKCHKTCVVDYEGIYQTCPFCGTSLINPLEECDKPVLEMPQHFNSLKEYLETGFHFLYFNAYDLLSQLANSMLNEYSNNFWTYAFLLISDIKMDIIFSLPNIHYQLTKEEIDEDLRARYYHYARLKYSNISQSQYGKISGFYPDLPGESRGKWKKAHTKYEEYLDVINQYCEISSKIRSNYLIELEVTATSDEQKTIVKNLKLWLDEVNHASIDLYRYNKEADTKVRNDYYETPSPGNKPKFLLYVSIYFLAFASFVLSMADIIISIINGEGFVGNNGYIAASIATFLYLFSLFYYLIRSHMFRRAPIISVASIVASCIISASGILTAGQKVFINWYFVILAIVSFSVMVISVYKAVKYVPKNIHRKNTVISNFALLCDNSFTFTFDFSWNEYIGLERSQLTYSKEWIDNV